MIDQLATNERTLFLVSGTSPLRATAGLAEHAFVLWARGAERRLYAEVPDAQSALWDGVADPHDEAARLGAEFRERSQFEPDLSSALLALDEIHLPFDDAAFAPTVLALVGRKRRYRRGDVALRDLRAGVGDLRLVKSPEDLDALREAARISAEAHVELMRCAWIGQTERDVAMRFDLELRRRGVASTAYETIVGSGPRALVLHARASERVIAPGELVLIDAAGTSRGRCADITRTLPSGEAFTPAQARLYAIVLAAQKAAIAAVRPGTTLDELHAIARARLAEGLRAEQWLPEGRDDLLDLWFPHSTSHWLGRDVHDPCPYRDEGGAAIPLAPGMVFTIEPGVYVRGDDAPAEVRGLGVRIEDDVLVTERGAEVLTAHVPKEIAEIESLRREQLRHR